MIAPRSNRKCRSDKAVSGIVTRFDKTDCSHAANWNFVIALMASR